MLVLTILRNLYFDLVFHLQNEMIEDSGNDDLVNSVIIETVKMVVSRPSQSTTQSFVQECSSTFQNFKRFKRVKPLMLAILIELTQNKICFMLTL